MSQKTRVVSVAGVLIVIVASVLLVSRSAAAQEAAAVVVTCQDWTPITARKAEAWMKDQIASGRTHFASITDGLCSW